MKFKSKLLIGLQKYRNFLSTLMKESKQAYYDKYFDRNWNNKNKWVRN